MRISLLGLPGSGKTTLAKFLSGIFKVMYISSGELARATGFAGSDAERSGKLDPDESKIQNLVKNAIGDSDMYILDGFPRMIKQIEDVQLPLEAVLYLKVGDHNIATDRLLKRARPDDTLDIIESRISTYFRNTYPLVEYFDKKGLLIEIDASGTIGNTIQSAVMGLNKKGIDLAKDYVKEIIKHDLKEDGIE